MTLAEPNASFALVSSWAVFAAILIPVVWLLGAVLPWRGKSHSGPLGGAAITLALAWALLSHLATGDLAAATAPVRGDLLAHGMALLVGLIGWVLLRFASAYLEGDPGRERFLRWLSATLASVSTLVVANHLAIVGIAWITTSLCLHQLLVFYPDRPLAILAAHKKFLLSRVAELCVVVGFALLAWTYDSLYLNEILSVATSTALPTPAVWAMGLLAVAAILKCAQLPFHGWLIQVMETPTPVSALLHAGIINLGGFLLLSFAPLLEGAEFARWSLVAAGGISAALAGLITMTRVSVKVGLAWSTCAQMGFMLVEIGLGLYELAFLHLVAHSLYKAHAFLSSGRTVAQSVHRRWAFLPQVHRPGRWVVATASGLGLATLAAAPGLVTGHLEPSSAAAYWILGLGLATLVGEALARERSALLGRALATAVAIAALYALWHEVFAFALAPTPTASDTWGPALLAVVLLSVPYAIYVSVRIAPTRPIWQRLYALLYHGLYLDEAFTRVVFQLWPPKTVHGKYAPAPLSSPEACTAHVS